MQTINNFTLWRKNNPALFSAIIFISIGIILLFLGLTGINNFGIGNFNQPILDWFFNHRQENITTIMQIITNIFSPIIIILAASIIAIVWVIKNKVIVRPLTLLGAIGLSAILTSTLKSAIANPRPNNNYMIRPFETDFSFPSGHTLTIMVFLLVIGYFLFHIVKSKTFLKAWLFMTFVVVIIIGISRLYLGYHWLTDIIGSMGIGFIIFAIFILTSNLLQKYSLLKH